MKNEIGKKGLTMALGRFWPKASRHRPSPAAKGSWTAQARPTRGGRPGVVIVPTVHAVARPAAARRRLSCGGVTRHEHEGSKREAPGNLRAVKAHRGGLAMAGWFDSGKTAASRLR
jgi:hypothetical protein